MTERRVSVGNGLMINVRDLGEGPAVLLIHGWSLSGEVWDRQQRVLAEAGCRVVAMDQRGHGDSDAPRTGYGIEELAADALGVLDGLGIETAAVVGWSLGGMVGLRLAHDRPERIRTLVMVASNGVAASRTVAFPFGVPADQQLATILAAEHADRVALRRRAVGDPFGTPPDEHTLDWLHRISLQTPSWAGRAAMRTLMCSDQTDLLPGITVPVTQIVGTADPALSLRGARWVRDQLGSALVEIECGHYPMLEAPDLFEEALLAGLSRVPGDLVAHEADSVSRQ
ncbi:MAG: alpha/beta hydrolase [Gordonia sp. (in: high G+C Gram-positive bacteria)]|uniref:alpha/beta fold hydrolase n=1 Tax=Gordonia sp. (in: high G+C Gram-positive bacteria) TaxID=84139 RepID=UPI003BB7E326